MAMNFGDSSDVVLVADVDTPNIALAATVAATVLPASTVEPAVAIGKDDAFLTHSRLSKNDESHQIVSSEERDIHVLEKGYRMILDHLSKLRRVHSEFPTETNAADYRLAEEKARKVHHRLTTAIEHSHLVGKWLAPPVDAFLTGRIDWNAWQPEDLSGRSSFLPTTQNHVNSQANGPDSQKTMDIKPVERPSDESILDNLSNVANGNSDMSNVNTMSNPNGNANVDTKQANSSNNNNNNASKPASTNLAARWTQLPTLPDAATAVTPPAMDIHSLVQNSSAVPVHGASTRSVISHAVPTASPSIAPSAPTIAQHMSTRTVDATTRDNYDVRSDVQAKAGVQARQSKARIFFATFMSKLMSTGGGGKENAAPHGQSNARHVTTNAGPVAPQRIPFFRRHCGGI